MLLRSYQVVAYEDAQCQNWLAPQVLALSLSLSTNWIPLLTKFDSLSLSLCRHTPNTLPPT